MDDMLGFTQLPPKFCKKKFKKNMKQALQKYQTGYENFYIEL